MNKRRNAIVFLCISFFIFNLFTSVLANSKNSIFIMDKDAKIPIENAIVRGHKTVLGHTNSKGLFAFSEDGLPDTVTIEALGYFPKYID